MFVRDVRNWNTNVRPSRIKLISLTFSEWIKQQSAIDFKVCWPKQKNNQNNHFAYENTKYNLPIFLILCAGQFLFSSPSFVLNLKWQRTCILVSWLISCLIKANQRRRSILEKLNIISFIIWFSICCSNNRFWWVFVRCCCFDKVFK